MVQAKGRFGLIGRIKIIAGVEDIVPHEFQRRAVQLVCSGFRDGIDVRRSLRAEFRRIDRFLDLEFLQGIDGRRDHKIIEVLIRNRDAIQRIKVMTRPLASDDNLPSRLGKSGAAGAHRREKHVVAEQGQLNELPAVQRQIDQALIVDNFADLGIRGPHERRRLGNCDFFVNRAYRQGKIQIEMLPALQHDAVAY